MAKTWRRLFYVWHRRLGIASALLVGVLTVTGVLLNHTQTLELAEHRLSAGWLLDWYGLAPQSPPLSFELGGQWLTILEGRVYLDARPVAEGLGVAVGALALPEALVVGGPEELLLLTPAGELIERLPAPAPLRRMGRLPDGRLAVDTPRGVLAADEALLSWRPAAQPPAWVGPGRGPAKIEQAVLRAHRGEGLPWERVLLDLHSGRILGPWGPYLMDAAALCLLLLTLSGLHNALRRR